MDYANQHLYLNYKLKYLALVYEKYKHNFIAGLLQTYWTYETYVMHTAFDNTTALSTPKYIVKRNIYLS